MASTIRNRVRLYQKLQKLAGDAVVQYVDDAVRGAADEIVGRMQFNAPKRTGTLADSIHYYRVAPMRYRIFAGGKETTKDGYNYALAVEFGTHKMGAEPFFFPTYRSAKAKARNQIKAAARKGIQSVAK